MSAVKTTTSLTTSEEEEGVTAATCYFITHQRTETCTLPVSVPQLRAGLNYLHFHYKGTGVIFFFFYFSSAIVPFCSGTIKNYLNMMHVL